MIQIYHNDSEFSKHLINHWIKRYPHLQKNITKISSSIEKLMGTGLADDILFDLFKDHEKNREIIFLLNSLREEYIDCFSPVIISEKLINSLKELLENQSVLELGNYSFISYILSSDIDINSTQSPKFKNNRDSFIQKQKFSSSLFKNTNAYILSWPEYDSLEACEYLKYMKKNDFLIYFGELEDGGCANEQFFKKLVENFIVDENKTKKIQSCYIRWGGVNDKAIVYKKITK